MLTNDRQLVYRADNHGQLFGWKGATIFQAGPSKAMNWYGTNGSGHTAAAGPRGNDTDAMCGNAVMYDATAGKILVIGGSVDYVCCLAALNPQRTLLTCLQQDANATANAHVITIDTPMDIAKVQTIGSMSYPRIFANAVVLPTGQTFISGGQSYVSECCQLGTRVVQITAPVCEH